MYPTVHWGGDYPSGYKAYPSIRDITAQSFHSRILLTASLTTSSHNTCQNCHIWGWGKFCGLFNMTTAPVLHFRPFSLVTLANVQGVILWLRHLVAGLLPHKPRFNARPAHV